MITLENVHKSFDIPVLRGVNLVIPPGCLYGLIGPAGSGKTVLLKIVTGLLRPDRGRVSVSGKDLSQLDELAIHDLRKRIGMQFQNNALFDYMTVADNIAFPLRRLTALDEQAIAQRVAERLEVVSLSGFQERLPTGLSGGQKRRVGVARATVTGAPIVIYDEPAAGLDPVTSQNLRPPATGAASRPRHRGHGVQRPGPTAPRYRSGRHDAPGAAHLRRHHRRGVCEPQPVRQAVRAWAPRWSPLEGRGAGSDGQFPSASRTAVPSASNVYGFVSHLSPSAKASDPFCSLA